jgi:hypothetical protein
MCEKFFNKWNSLQKTSLGKTMENEIKELEPMKACKYLGVEENHNI